jgi:hypothetical protein
VHVQARIDDSALVPWFHGAGPELEGEKARSKHRESIGRGSVPSAKSC